MTSYYNDELDLDQCVRCPWSKKKAARNDRFLTLGEPVTGVTLHLRLCNTHAGTFDREMNQWVQIGSEILPYKVPAPQLTSVPAAAPTSARDDNQRLLELTERARQRKLEADKAAQARKLPSLADTWHITAHAAERIKERGFTADGALEAAAYPEKVLPTRDRPGTVYHVRGDCCVVVNPTVKAIITVMDKFAMVARQQGQQSSARKGA